MSSINSPGVSVQEISLLPLSVPQAATAVPAFVGATEIQPASNVPVRITSLLEFEQHFGGPHSDLPSTAFLAVYDSGGEILVNDLVRPTSYSKMLYYSMQFYFLNGGGPCYVVSAELYTDTYDIVNYQNAIDKLKVLEEPTLIVLPTIEIDDPFDYFDVAVAHALDQCAELEDRFVLADVVNDSSDAMANVDDFRNFLTNTNGSYGAVYYPPLEASFPYADSSIRFLDTAGSAELNNLNLNQVKASTDPAIQAKYASIQSQVTAAISKLSPYVPASVAAAAVYCTVDRERGIWKAPANVSLTAVKRPIVSFTDDENGQLNINGTDFSVNAIRQFTGRGTLIWGARTLAGYDDQWRYVPVRRLYMMVKTAINKSLSQLILEPNVATTWLRAKSMIEHYLNNIWRQGGLFGSTPAHAYFVKIGLGETMTATDIANGVLNVEVGFAPTRPAEFITLKFSHQLQQS